MSARSRCRKPLGCCIRDTLSSHLYRITSTVSQSGCCGTLGYKKGCCEIFLIYIFEYRSWVGLLVHDTVSNSSSQQTTSICVSWLSNFKGYTKNKTRNQASSDTTCWFACVHSIKMLTSFLQMIMKRFLFHLARIYCIFSISVICSTFLKNLKCLMEELTSYKCSTGGHKVQPLL